ncbi:MAG TPA: hypothetical protein VFA11_09680 [Acidimicrobiales bacterium]|nr:hypothetical protein [Acidimicrobiales bacterium]
MSIKEIRTKIDRAREHLGVLAAEVDAWAAGDPVIYIAARWHRYQWLRGPPLRWAAIFGDCVHNLRSALDHMIWDLSGGTGNAPPRSEFPIFDDQTKYLERGKNGKPVHGSGLAKIEGVKDLDARRVIRNLQPFKASEPHRHPLWVLHELDRVDKHRALHPVLGWPYGEPWRLDIHDDETLRPGFRQIRALEGRDYPETGLRTRTKRRADLVIELILPGGTVEWTDNVDVLLSKLVDYVEREAFRGLEPWLEYP